MFTVPCCVLGVRCRLNFSYVLTPSSGAEVSIPATATLTWPRVLDVPEGNIVKFPSTTIGSFSVSEKHKVLKEKIIFKNVIH